MHCVSSSLCFWIWTIIRETMESLTVYDDEEKEIVENITEKKTAETSFYDDYYENFSGKELYLNGMRVFTKGCESDKGLRLIYQNFSPYLYPFSVEYSILVGKSILK